MADPMPINLQTMLADSEAVDRLFQSILGRPIGNDDFKRSVNRAASVDQWIKELVRSEEFKIGFLDRHGSSRPTEAFIPDASYRRPTLQAEPLPRSIMVIGSCMTAGWKETIEYVFPGTTVRHQLFNNASELETLSDADIGKSAFQIVHLPLRSMINEAEYFTLSLSEEGLEAIDRLFEQSVARVRRNLHAALKYNRATGIPTFVLNFAVPQQNPLGMLMPRYALSNFCYYVEQLNRALADMIAQERAVHLIDFDAICASLGKRYIIDDITTHINHGSYLGGTSTSYDIDLTPHGVPEELFAPKRLEATLAIFNECVAAYRVISPSRKVKLVVFDLDGTLWRGVAAEQDEVGAFLTEGWPLGILEAAAFLKKRGILVAIASKNDPEIVRGIWQRLYEKRFPLANFVSTKISWNSKVSAIGEILAETNLLADNCLFVDDNPVERDQVKRAYPTMHVIDGPIMNWRRLLLWSPELQVPFVTDESVNRTRSIQSVIQRESLKKDSDEEDYVASLGVAITRHDITNRDHPRFNRAFELLNKTNQFNLTGCRWTEQDINAHFAAGGTMVAADVADRLSDYGLTAVMLVHDGACVQMVLSCRTFGLRVEFALFDRFLQGSAGRERTISYVRTDKNGPSRLFLEKIGLDLSDLTTSGDSRSFTLPADFSVDPALCSGVTLKTVEQTR